ncbi:MAG: Crp/Fnr family transcriptional regulator [Hyphomicrobiaceae bacterium]|nr:Crp/Fnr family transcriptional regulator [Hyphomicrobiaceae bacterium]
MTPQAGVAQLLCNTKLFGKLDDGSRLDVARQMRETSFRAGQSIFSRGDVGKDVYLVLEGRVRLSVLSSEGRELTFAHAARGDVFGEIAALDGGLRTADATAVSAVRAMTLSHTTLHRLVQSSPPFAEAAIAFLCSRIRETDLQLEGVALHRIEVRLARFLLGLLRQRDGVATSGREKIDIGMSQGELALLLGASRPKVNAALTLLEDMEAIRRQDSLIDCDIDELRQMAELE